MMGPTWVWVDYYVFERKIFIFCSFWNVWLAVFGWFTTWSGTLLTDCCPTDCLIDFVHDWNTPSPATELVCDQCARCPNEGLMSTGLLRGMPSIFSAAWVGHRVHCWSTGIIFEWITDILFAQWPQVEARSSFFVVSRVLGEVPYLGLRRVAPMRWSFCPEHEG